MHPKVMPLSIHDSQPPAMLRKRKNAADPNADYVVTLILFGGMGLLLGITIWCLRLDTALRDVRFANS